MRLPVEDDKAGTRLSSYVLRLEQTLLFDHHNLVGEAADQALKAKLLEVLGGSVFAVVFSDRLTQIELDRDVDVDGAQFAAQQGDLFVR